MKQIHKYGGATGQQRFHHFFGWCIDYKFEKWLIDGSTSNDFHTFFPPISQSPYLSSQHHNITVKQKHKYGGVTGQQRFH